MSFTPTVKISLLRLFIKGTFLSLLLVLDACQNHETLDTSGRELCITANINNLSSRVINKTNEFIDGSVLGLWLDDGTATTYDAYSNLHYTYNKTALQKWTASHNVLLLDTKATLYGYYPYNADINISAIPVDMTADDQTDWLYATPVTGVCKDKADAVLNFNHMLANIQIIIDKGTYTGEGLISTITLESDALAPKGTFNAAQTTPGYTAFEDKGQPFVRTINAVTDGNPIDIMVVPTGTTAAIKINLKVDDTEFTTQTAELTLQAGHDYQFTLQFP